MRGGKGNLAVSAPVATAIAPIAATPVTTAATATTPWPGPSSSTRRAIATAASGALSLPLAREGFSAYVAEGGFHGIGLRTAGAFFRPVATATPVIAAALARA